MKRINNNRQASFNNIQLLLIFICQYTINCVLENARDDIGLIYMPSTQFIIKHKHIFGTNGTLVFVHVFHTTIIYTSTSLINARIQIVLYNELIKCFMSIEHEPNFCLYFNLIRKHFWYKNKKLKISVIQLIAQYNSDNRNIRVHIYI